MSFKKKKSYKFKIVKDLKQTLCDQNKVIVNVLSEVNVLLKSNLGPVMSSSKYLDQFPLETEGELENMELEINDDTKDAIVRYY